MDSPEWELCKLTLDRLITAVSAYCDYAHEVITPYKLRGIENPKLTEEENVGSWALQQKIAVAAANYVHAIEQYNNSIDPKKDIHDTTVYYN
jgi:hypothetical protein